jgi:ribonuclease P protein subunit POP4
VSLREIEAEGLRRDGEACADAGVVVVPKEHTVFRIDIPQRDEDAAEEAQGAEGGMDVDRDGGGRKKEPNLIFELHGDQFQTRAPDRATKKVKAKRMDDL